MYYEKIFKALNVKKIRYLLIGGLAVNLYGVPRFTKDIDLIIGLEQKNVDKVKDVFASLGYQLRQPIDFSRVADEAERHKWVHEKNLKALTFFDPKNPWYQVDIVIVHVLDFDEAYERCVTMKGVSMKVKVVDFDDLIILKKNAQRKQDLSDIEALRKARRIFGKEYGADEG